MATNFLGKGWKFPIQVDQTTGRIMLSEAEEDIEEAIKIIILTAKGERMMRPNFGSNIKDYVFDMNDEMTLGLLESEIELAITQWEHRVKDIEVNASYEADTPEKILLSISYVVRRTNTLFNKVYPFYIQEGT